MSKNVAVQWKSDTFIGNDLISVTSDSTKLEWACDSRRMYECAKRCLFTKFMTGPALSAFRSMLSLMSNDANRHGSTITPYERALNQLLRR